MRHLLFEYGELPSHIIDLPVVEYDNELNLNILKSSGKPAIEDLDNCVTQTISRTDEEANDTDDDSYVRMGTKTFTLVDVERTDSDEEANSNFIKSLITMTTTKVEMEGTDND